MPAYSPAPWGLSNPVASAAARHGNLKPMSFDVFVTYLPGRPRGAGSASFALRGSGHYRGWRARRQRQQPFQRVRGSRCGTGPLIGTDAANRGNGPCSTLRQRPVDATTAPLLAESRPGLHLAQPACYSPTILPPLRVVLQREALPQRRALYSGDTTKTFKHLFGGDRLSSIGLSD